LHIARGLLTDPKILFMDEPTIGLDPLGAREVRQLISELCREGKTIFLNMLEADELCSKLSLIDKGNIIVEGSSSEIKQKFSKIEIFKIILKKIRANISSELNKIKGIKRVTSSSDGPIHKITVSLAPGLENKNQIKKVLGDENIESITMREPTLEEAYLSIIRQNNNDTSA